jgi:two-component system alkaline phosphatase synthesis response regulator PhoP
MTHRILLVEDEQHLRDGIRENLQAEGYEVLEAKDGEAALVLFAAHPVDLVILDVMLPLRDGYAVCEQIRKQGSWVPVLFLTAKNQPEDRVLGLQLGGDDYLGKPFHLKELLLRVAAVLRRQPSVDALKNADVIHLAGWSIDLGTYQATGPQGQRERLLQKEALILKLLYDHAGRVVSRDTILDHVWGYDVFPSTRTVDNFIVQLRKKFEPNPTHPRHLHTVRGVGYRLVLEGSEDAT